MNISSPQEIKRSGTSGLFVSWTDGFQATIPSEKLRRECPCAECREKRGDSTHAKPLTGKKSLLKIVESSAEQETELQEIWGVGQYALGMRWADGHNSGIYTFSLLRELAEQQR